MYKMDMNNQTLYQKCSMKQSLIITVTGSRDLLHVTVFIENVIAITTTLNSSELQIQKNALGLKYLFFFYDYKLLKTIRPHAG